MFGEFSENVRNILHNQKIVTSKKNTRTSESGAYTSFSNPDTSVAVEEYEVRTRPIGQKAAKRKGKEKITMLEDVITESMANVIEKFTAFANKKLEKLEGCNAANENKKSEIFQYEYDILMKDTTNMTEEQLSVHLHACEMIKKKWGM
ncbi:uncharacterized protein [Henckelia pumila]|uniref:uncharacterized protein n=1 Tax=Henckelia pumila TaxID=405737 RepID=UPI003C6E39D9